MEVYPEKRKITLLDPPHVRENEAQQLPAPLRDSEIGCNYDAVFPQLLSSCNAISF